MLKYFKYSRELKAVIKFQVKLNQFHNFEENIKTELLNRGNPSGFRNHRKIQLYIQKQCGQKHGTPYKILRAEIAQKIPTIRRIAAEIGIQTERYSCPPPIISGGPRLPVGIFDSALEDLGYEHTEHATREDTLNKMIGILNETKKHALVRMLNPLTYLQFLLSMPFLIIKQTGFNTDKIEDELIGKTVKLIFLVVLIYLLLKLGFTQEQLINAIKIKSLS
jgi:hypothetical protein